LVSAATTPHQFGRPHRQHAAGTDAGNHHYGDDLFNAAPKQPGPKSTNQTASSPLWPLNLHFPILRKTVAQIKVD